MCETQHGWVHTQTATSLLSPSIPLDTTQINENQWWRTYEASGLGLDSSIVKSDRPKLNDTISHFFCGCWLRNNISRPSPNDTISHYFWGCRQTNKISQPKLNDTTSHFFWGCRQTKNISHSCRSRTRRTKRTGRTRIPSKQADDPSYQQQNNPSEQQPSSDKNTCIKKKVSNAFQIFKYTFLGGLLMDEIK